MAQEFTFAPIAELAAEIIREHHKHLVAIQIVFRFFHEKKKKNDKMILGLAGKLNAVERHAYGEIVARDEETGQVTDWILNPGFESGQSLEEGFRIEIFAETWLKWEKKGQTQAMRALIDHELCHCQTEEDEDGDTKLVIVGHDMEEFACIIERYGDWKGELDQFSKAKIKNEQLKLDFKVVGGGR